MLILHKIAHIQYGLQLQVIKPHIQIYTFNYLNQSNKSSCNIKMRKSSLFCSLINEINTGRVHGILI